MSRSSGNSSNAQMKDLVGPGEVNIQNCGSIHVIKHDDAVPPALLDGAEFDLLADNAPVGGSPGPEDTFVAECITVAGVCDFPNVLEGEYWVVETVAPAGHNLPVPAFQHVTVVGGETVEVTFVDPRQRGAIQVTKTRKHAADGPGSHPHGGVEFVINGTTVTTDTTTGVACVDGLLFGDYTVHENTPTGYAGEADKTVTVDNNASCTDSPFGGETVSFSNTPLTNVTVSVNSQVDGGTASTVECEPTDADPDMTTGANGDGTVTISNLQPQTLVCTIVIDP